MPADQNDIERFIQVRESREQLSQMISGSPIPTFVIDCNHMVTHFNRACENLTGIPAKDIVGTKDQWKAFYSDQRPVMADFILDQASDSNIADYYEGKYRKSEVKTGAYEAEDYFPDLGDDGKWLFFTAAPVMDMDGNVVGAIETLQDITTEKRVSQMNAAMLRISMALHEYSYLEDLLSYISSEIKQLLGSEGALVILLDEEANELYFPGIAYDDPDTEKRVREVRFTPDQIVAGTVIKTGIPHIINDTATGSLYSERDKKLGYKTRNLVQVPIHSGDRIIGVLTGLNKTGGHFREKDIDLLNSLAGTVALAIENTRYAEELRKAYREVIALNNAKGKAINHLSHELKTPVAILSDAISMVEDELEPIPEEEWKPFMGMIERNLKRITEIQEEVTDIIDEKEHKNHGLISWIFDQCSDEISLIAAQESGKGDIAARVKQHIDDLFYLAPVEFKDISPVFFIKKRIEEMKERFSQRDVDIKCDFQQDRNLRIPEDVLRKLVDGLIRNAVENTPDGGCIDVTIKGRGERTVLTVSDYGVGIPEEYHVRIFEGFFPTQEMTAYSTKKPFDFNAGGKGADLLRMKIFSEKYNFSIEMDSSRCSYIKKCDRACPGSISKCSGCNTPDECRQMGGTRFVVTFS